MASYFAVRLMEHLRMVLENLVFDQHAPNWNHRKQGRHLILSLRSRIVLIVQSHKDQTAHYSCLPCIAH